MAKTKKTKKTNNSKGKNSKKIESHTDSEGRTFYYDANKVPYYLDLDYKPYYFDDNGTPVLYEDGVLDIDNFVGKVDFEPDNNEDQDVINELQGILESKNPAKAARKAAKKIDKEEKLEKKKNKKSKKSKKLTDKKHKEETKKESDENQNQDQGLADEQNLSDEYYDNQDNVESYPGNYNYDYQPIKKPLSNNNQYRSSSNHNRNKGISMNQRYLNSNRYNNNVDFNNQYYNNGTYYGNEQFLKGPYKNNFNSRYFGKNINNYSKSFPYMPTRYSINPFLAKYGRSTSIENIIQAREWVNSIERRAISDVDERYSFIYRNELRDMDFEDRVAREEHYQKIRLKKQEILTMKRDFLNKLDGNFKFRF
ncbi:MAG: hypothetical protein HRS57_02425 [Mycoplasmataceae bacterium]|nr:hypothetical protein [Mycoplasmataceae bacterium]